MSDQLLLLLSGPNLNLLGERQPDVYGTETLDDHVESARLAAGARGLTLEHVQSNHEGAIVDYLQASAADASGVVINAGAVRLLMEDTPPVAAC